MLSNLKLSAAEHCVLSDMKRVIDELKNNLFENYNEKDFDELFMILGAKRAKELINLFRKIKTRLSYDLFECEFIILYFCIMDPKFVNVFYLNVERYSFDDGERSHDFDGGEGWWSINQRF
ncbi:P52 family lipoprotein [Borreliella bavariensis]|uniref:P52 family lipoprotein n=1 Tax=Borreliella bavariensis TaxID=664662 RepID=UPI00165D4979|nr:P52 family lipoprotein [Borreliella bavariensis]